MFKYGSFRNFIVKFILGIIFFVFGLGYLASLYSYSPNDPGFSQLNNNINKGEIKNILGLFGAYLSSYSLVFIGILSYLFAFFITIQGGKFFLGITSRLIILKFISNFLGIIIVNVSLRSLDLFSLEVGLISQFIIDFFSIINLEFLDNSFAYIIINILALVFGLYLILLSFRINFSWINKIVYFLKILKYFKFLFLIFGLLKYLKFKKRTKKKTLKSEPTIKKRNYVNLSQKRDEVSQTEKQLELGNFSFNLPSKKLLSKSIVETIKTKSLIK